MAIGCYGFLFIKSSGICLSMAFYISLIRFMQPKTCLGPVCQSGADPCKQSSLYCIFHDEILDMDSQMLWRLSRIVVSCSGLRWILLIKTDVSIDLLQAGNP